MAARRAALPAPRGALTRAHLAAAARARRYGDESRKERFSLPDELIQPFLDGRLTPGHVRELLAADKSFKGSVDAAVELAAEVQGHVLNKKLKPMLRTQYMRTAFQKKGDATVRARAAPSSGRAPAPAEPHLGAFSAPRARPQVRSSLDTELCMALEPVASGEYRYSGGLSRDQICQVGAAHPPAQPARPGPPTSRRPPRRALSLRSSRTACSR